jgi:hypothetical protein
VGRSSGEAPLYHRAMQTVELNKAGPAEFKRAIERAGYRAP